MHLPSLAVTLSSLAALVAQVSAGMYAAPVVELDAKSFKQVMANEHASIVAFVAPWCGHCKSLGPEYSAAAASLAPLIPFYMVDCDEDRNKPLCAQHGVQGFPTIKAFPRASKGAARDYNGERRRGALVEYAKTLVPDRVKKLRLEGGAAEGVVEKYRAEKPELPHALLVHASQPSIPFLWKVLGHRLSGKALLGYVKDAKHDILASVGEASGDARLLFWAPGADQASVSVYKGPMKFNPLLEWLEAALAGDVRESEPEESEKPKQPKGDDEAARRAKLRAKMDEAERRDRLRREKLAAQRAAQAAETEDEGTPVDTAPEPEAAEDAEDEPAQPEVVERAAEEPVDEEATGDEVASGTESAPEPEAAEDAAEEAAQAAARLEAQAEAVPEEDEEFEHDEL